MNQENEIGQTPLDPKLSPTKGETNGRGNDRHEHERFK